MDREEFKAGMITHYIIKAIIWAFIIWILVMIFD